MLVWLNGEFVSRDDARISAFDAGFQHGVGLFETMLARHGRIFRVHQHLDRLRDSAKELRLAEQLQRGPLAEACELVLKRNEMTDARVRLTVTGGDLNWLQTQGESQQRPTLLVVAQPPTRYPDAFFEKGVTVTIADGRLNPLDPFGGHKTLNYWPRIHALQAAAGVGAGESLWFTVTNHLASGSVSNVFLVWNDRLVVPPARGEEEDGALRAPVLPGITRRAILELADDLGLPVDFRMPTYEDLRSADELFLTNSSWGVLPVTAVERQPIGEGVVGEWTRRLRRAWSEVVESECADASMR